MDIGQDIQYTWNAGKFQFLKESQVRQETFKAVDRTQAIWKYGQEANDSGTAWTKDQEQATQTQTEAEHRL